MKSKLKENKLVLLCCLIYFSSYLTRNNYAAALTEIINDLQITKQAASVAVTGSFITYGAGQLISGVLGDRIKPKTVIAFGMAATSLVNLLMVILPGIEAMTALWIFNGFFQAMLWPPLVKILADNMNIPKFNRSIVAVSCSSSIANILLYILVPAAITLSGWRSAFLLSGVMGTITVIIWHIGTKNISSTKRETVEYTAVQQTECLKDAILKSGLIFIIPAIIVQGILRDGIATWMPTYISEVFNLGASISILTSVILPIFTIISVSASSALEEKVNNVVKTSIILFGTGLIATVIMIAVFSKAMIIEVVLMALINSCMHGVNLMLIGRVPRFFSKTGKISTVSGLVNASSYIGAALSSYGFAVISERVGWNGTVVFWAIAGFAGLGLCLLCLKKWSNYCKEYYN